jgi:Alternative complex III, ActD subunit
MKTRSLLYGFLAEFDSPAALKECVRRAHQAGFRKVDAFTPFPVEGVAEELGLQRSAVSLIVLIGGILGGLTGAVMQYYSSVYDYPLNIGGRPLNSWPSFVVITFELTILFAGLFGVFGMLAVNGLPKPHHPLFNEPRFDRATQDRFFFCIEAKDPKFDRESTWSFLASLNPEGVYAVHDLP